MSGTSPVGAMVLREDAGTIRTGYSCFALRAWGDEVLQGAVAADNTLLTILDGDSDRIEDLVVNTADQWGPFHVTTRLYDAEPGDAGDEWEDVVEMSLDAGSSLIVTELVDNDPQIELLPEAGQYRLRVSARGRRIRDDDPESDFDDDTTPPKEWYLLEAWPAPVTEPRVLRLTSPFAHNELNPPAPLVIPNGEAGLAASVRIGRDVDRRTGARALSGDLGSVQVRRTIRGTRRRLFRWCAHLTTWSHEWVEGPSWSWSGSPPSEGAEYAPGMQGWAWSHRHADQLTGERGCVRYTYIDVKVPHYAIRDWEWLVNPSSGTVTIFDKVPLLDRPSRMTVTLDQTRDDAGDPWTTITIDHEHLPAEWLDDMRTYWDYQLAIADHANYGIPQ